MFEGIVIGIVIGCGAGVMFGKYVYSEATSIKAHITGEIKSLEERVKARL
jgi:hypothetical protein